MKVFIAEDEPPARERLIQALSRIAPQVRVVGHADSVKATADWLATHPPPDLLLLDIQLSDGLSLELFENRELVVPVIFTTAYDQFAIDAFRALAVDYLLKPIDEAALARAIEKAEKLRRGFGSDVMAVLSQLQRPRWRQRLLGRKASAFHSFEVGELAYVVSLDKLSHAVLHDGSRLLVETPLAELETQLDPSQFFRANRQTLLAARAVAGFAPAGKGRLKLQLRPALAGDLVVSQERAAAFKAWLDR
ncbi:MAG: response regulator transcription factor [Rubrivivax sp.]|nr:MAG: response regulator transcription factor [Rubrivivax sp.]